MKKHLIVAIAVVMIMAITAPALAANVGGTLDFGYTYDLTNKQPEAPTAGWGLNVSGNVSDNVSYRIGFENGADVIGGQPFAPSAAWIQAKNTPVGTATLGAFDMAFGEGNSAPWIMTDDDDNVLGYNPLNVQVNNALMGVNLAGGVQFASNGNIHAVGASANVKPMADLDATVGVLATNNGGWSPAFGYSANYTGIENLNLGLRGNLQSGEIIGSAAYQVMPNVKVSGEYGKLDAGTGQMMVGAEASFGKLHGGASYTKNTDTVIDLNAGYDFELTKGLTIGITGDHAITNGVGATSMGAAASIAF